MGDKTPPNARSSSSHSGSLNFNTAGQSTPQIQYSTPFFPALSFHANASPSPYPAPSTPAHIISPSIQASTPAPATPRRRLARFLATQKTQALRVAGSLVRSPSRSPKKKKRRSPRTKREKGELVLKVLKEEIGWTLGDLFLFLFALKDDDSPDGRVHRSKRHAGMVSSFMRGNTTYRPAHLLHAWLRHPDGRPQSASETEQMYSLSTPFIAIQAGRPALTSFAVQTVQDQLLYERRQAVKPSAGLHASRTKYAEKAGRKFEEVGPDFIRNTTGILRRHQPLTFDLLVVLATPKMRSDRGSSEPEHDQRPPYLVVTQALSAINFSHNRYANRLPLATGILFLGTAVPNLIFRYACRVGISVSYSTTYLTLERLGTEDQEKLKEIGQDPNRTLICRIDNVQGFHKQRELRVGREDQVLMGTAGLAVEAVLPDPNVLEFWQKDQYETRNLREKLTVHDLLAKVDWPHLDKVMSFHWLLTLVNYVPQLSKYKSDVIKLFRTEGARLVIPPTQKSVIHPFSTNSKNEALVSELKQAVLDFFEQMGQTQDNHQLRFLFMGGDGLTFEKLIQLLHLSQLEESDFDRLRMLQPFLELFHTEWGDASRIGETHWGDDLCRDPSTLGQNASKIGYKKPSNLKKIDYYSGTHLIYLVLAARMIDCWRIGFDSEDIFAEFEKRQEQDRLPNFTELRDMATTLQRRYSSLRAYHRAKQPHDGENPYSVPLGNPWIPPDWMNASRSGDTSLPERNEGQSGPKRTRKGKKVHIPAPEEPFFGDEALANSTRFILDACLSKEVADAVAAGDVGRVWEVFKFWLFTFSGSSHTKYPGYLLEMICRFDLESSPELREFFMKNWLVNPRGEAGKSMEGDLAVEHNNGDLQAIPQRKDSDWDDKYLRKVISPNTFRIHDTKEAFISGCDLRPTSKTHTKPHDRAEFRILYDMYREVQLHSFRPGRSYGEREREVDDYERGVQRLMDGKLEQWIKDSTSMKLDMTSTLENDACGVPVTVESNEGQTLEDESENTIIEAEDKSQDANDIVAGPELELAWRFAAMVNGEFTTEARLEDIMQQEMEHESQEWENEHTFNEWQEDDPEPIPEVVFIDEE